MKISPEKKISIIMLAIASTVGLFPGSYSVDSWSMYNQVISGHYNDWHAPAFTFLWRLLYQATSWYFVIYLLQMAFYWLFVSLLLSNTPAWTFRVGLLFAMLLLFIPQYVMKDALNAILWGLAVLIFVLAGNAAGARRLLLSTSGLLLLAYGLCIRINGLVAVLPLLYIGVEILLPASAPPYKKLVVTTVFVAITVAGNQWVTYDVLHAEKTYPQYKLKLLDIAGISLLSHISYIPSCIGSYEHFEETRLYNKYSPASFDDIYWPPDGSLSVIPAPNEQLNGCVDSSWRVAVMAHPALYLKNRAEGFLYYLRIKKRFAANEYWNTAIWIDPNNPLHLSHSRNFFTNGLVAVYSFLSYTPFFDPWFWLLLSIILFVICMARFRNNGLYLYKMHALIQLSAILFILSQFPVYQHDRDFRYNYWNVIACFITIVYMVKLRKTEPR